MGTRGLWGFRKNGKDTLMYHHYDSYPDGLGLVMLNFLSKHGTEELNEIAGRIEIVRSNEHVTPEQLAECEKIYTQAEMPKSKTWYELLKNATYDPEWYAKGFKFMSDDTEFIKDSLFCEHVYIINLDDGVMEYWVGFQRTPCKGSRYGQGMMNNGYYPCKHMLDIPLNAIYGSTEKEIELALVRMQEITNEDAEAVTEGALTHPGPEIGQKTKSEVDAHNENMDGVDFSETTLKNAVMENCHGNAVSFRKANLEKARVIESDFHGADFSESCLRQATLSYCGLRRALFTEADLSYADLSRSDLTKANLSGADLTCANLMGADLSGACLEGANLNGTNFLGANTNSVLSVALNGTVINCCLATGMVYSDGRSETLDEFQARKTDNTGLEEMSRWITFVSWLRLSYIAYRKQPVA